MIHPTPIVGVSEHVRSVRGSGHSTSIALAILSKAIACPGEAVSITDHFGTVSADRHLADRVRAMRDHLSLRATVYQDFIGGRDTWWIKADAVGATEPTFVKRGN